MWKQALAITAAVIVGWGVAAEEPIPLAPFPTALKGSIGNDGRPSAAFNGRNWMVAWTNWGVEYPTLGVRTALLTPDGEPLTKPAYTLPHYSGSHRVAWTGARFLVAQNLNVPRFAQVVQPNVVVTSFREDGSPEKEFVLESGLCGGSVINWIGETPDGVLVAWEHCGFFRYQMLDPYGLPLNERHDVANGSHGFVAVAGGSPVWVIMSDDQLVAYELEGEAISELSTVELDGGNLLAATELESEIWAAVSKNDELRLYRLASEGWAPEAKIPLQGFLSDFEPVEGEIWMVWTDPSEPGLPVTSFDPDTGIVASSRLIADPILAEYGAIVQTNGESLLFFSHRADTETTRTRGHDLFSAIFRPAAPVFLNGSHLVSFDLFGGQRQPVSVSDGNEVIVAWRQYDPTTDGWRVMVQFLDLQHGSSSEPIQLSQDEGAGPHDIACREGRCMVAGGTWDLLWWAIVDRGGIVVEGTLDEPFSTRYVRPTVAAGRDGFRLVWETPEPDPRKLEGVIFDRSGNATPPFELDLGVNERKHPKIAYCGTTYWLSWAEHTAFDRRGLQLAKFSTSGNLTSVDLITEANRELTNLSVECLGDQPVLTWQRGLETQTGATTFVGLFDGERLAEPVEIPEYGDFRTLAIEPDVLELVGVWPGLTVTTIELDDFEPPIALLRHMRTPAVDAFHFSGDLWIIRSVPQIPSRLEKTRLVLEPFSISRPRGIRRR